MFNLSQENIQKLEDEKVFSFISDHDKVEIALMFLGLKPAFLIAWWEPLNKENLTQNEARELEQFLIKNGFKVRIIFTTENQSVWCRFFCAKDNETLENLIGADYVEGDSKEIIKKKDEKLGILLGYPKTAVEAYTNDTCINDDELPDEVKKSPVLKFIGRRLSRVNWSKEFEDTEHYIGILKSTLPNLYNRVVSEKIPNEKDVIWDGIRRQVDSLTDRLGMPVDEGIKNVVIGLNANGISTISSCGGHIEEDRFAFPWVGCAASDQPRFRFKNEEKIKETIAKKYKIKPEDIFNVGNDAAEKEYYKITGNSVETEEYAEWDKKNVPLENKVIGYIKEFYVQRKNDPIVRIEPGSIYPGCLIDIPDEDEKRWRETLPRAELKDKIREAQKEMEQFGNFLKERFFADKN